MNTLVGTPYSEDIWDEVETWSRDRLAELQLSKLKKQLVYVAENSVYYSRTFREAGFDPRDFNSLEDLRKLPLTRKRDLVAGIEENPPFGTHCAVKLEDAVRVHFSSGTTGSPTPVLWSAFDIERWQDLYARYMYAQGLRKTDVFHCMFGYSWFVGGLGATLAASRIGALVIPGGSVDTERQIDTILRYRPRAVVGTPSFMVHLAEAAANRSIDLATSSVEIVCVGGEPGASLPATRSRIQSLWGAKVFDCYGALECQPIGWETALQLGPQLAEDFIYVEVLDPDTDEPVEDGSPGVLVLTHLDKQASPLVRWWTGDIVVRDSSVAPDGRTHARLTGGVKGRADDMLIVRGVNLFPTAVEEIVRSHPGLTDEFQLIADDSMKDAETGFYRGVGLKVESPDADRKAVAYALSSRLREKLQVRFEVEVLEPGTLPRSVHKAKRLIRS